MRQEAPAIRSPGPLSVISRVQPAAPPLPRRRYTARQTNWFQTLTKPLQAGFDCGVEHCGAAGDGVLAAQALRIRAPGDLRVVADGGGALQGLLRGEHDPRARVHARGLLARLENVQNAAVAHAHFAESVADGDAARGNVVEVGAQLQPPEPEIRERQRAGAGPSALPARSFGHRHRPCTGKDLRGGSLRMTAARNGGQMRARAE